MMLWYVLYELLYIHGTQRQLCLSLRYDVVIKTLPQLRLLKAKAEDKMVTPVMQ